MYKSTTNINPRYRAYQNVLLYTFRLWDPKVKTFYVASFWNMPSVIQSKCLGTDTMRAVLFISVCDIRFNEFRLYAQFEICMAIVHEINGTFRVNRGNISNNCYLDCTFNICLFYIAACRRVGKYIEWGFYKQWSKKPLLRMALYKQGQRLLLN